MLIIFFGRNSISLYGEKVGLIGSAEIGKELLDHLEISEHNSFHQFIKKFLESNNIKRQKVLILLANDIVFTRESVNKKEELIPLRNPVDIYKGAENIIYTFNAEIINCFKHNLVEKKCQIMGIYPEQLFNLIDSSNLQSEEIMQIKKTSQKLRSLNLIVDETAKKSHNIEILLIVNLVFMLVLLGVVARNQKIIKELQTNKSERLVQSTIQNLETTSEKNMEPTLENKSMPTVEELKKTLKIKILNASGKGGLAAKAKSILEKNAFSVASIGNAESMENTTIVAKSNATSEFIEEIEKLLNIADAEQSTAEDTEDVEKVEDIVITLGKNTVIR